MDVIERQECSINRHPWEISRCHSILNIVRMNPLSTQYADIGAGDMFFVRNLLRFTDKPIYAVDQGYAETRKLNSIIQCKHITDVPAKSVDFVFLMDVLEHCEDENQFLRSVVELLRGDGRILITVPAFQFLFSNHDVFLKHFRRYAHGRLIPVLQSHRLAIREYFYFYTSLLVIRLVKLLLSKSNHAMAKRSSISTWKLGRSSIVTISLARCLDLEFFFSRILRRIGITIPGLSLCLICQKRSS